ncbi:MAG: MYXO-CTERM sorting domain-containing protein [Polyangiaceae bacterium]
MDLPLLGRGPSVGPAKKGDCTCSVDGGDGGTGTSAVLGALAVPASKTTSWRSSSALA